MQLFPKLPDTLIYGGDYNPEQWPEDVWQEDVRLMREAGVNMVSLAIFSWSRLQPSEDTFDFGWLDRIMDLLHANDIAVCLATATASPPAWLSRQYPDVLPVTDEGVTLYPGSRQHYSPSSPSYRRAAGRLVGTIAERYREHPALAAWHINNEYACHMPECHGEASTRAFREWLKERYQTLEALNEAWNAAFWSQLYYDWEEIFTPRKAPYISNPTQCLDFKRFTSDAFLECYLMERNILRELTPEIPVTTNFMGFFKPLDYRRWAEELDFTSWDSYPDPVDEQAGRSIAAAGHDLTRSLKPDKPFVLLEQATSAVNWRPLNMPKRPGLMRLWSLQTVARGGDGVMFFQWRASKGGAETYHASLIQHTGPANNRVWREVCALGQELAKLRSVAGTAIHPRVAIAIDWHAWWAIELPAKPAEIPYVKTVLRFHQWFYEHNIPVDFVHPTDDLNGFDLLVAPALYLLDADSAGNLKEFTAAGGRLLASYFSGIVDENNQVYLDGYPGILRDLLGLSVEEFAPYPEGRGNHLLFGGNRHACDRWCDVIHLEGAAALATFESDFFAGSPAITRHDWGDGAAFYLGTRPDDEAFDRVLRQICAEAEVAPVLETPDGIEATLRESTDRRFLFLLNHRDESVKVSLAAFAGRDLVSGETIRGQLTLEALDARVLLLEN